MNEMERLRHQIELYKSMYPSGTRILLQEMGDDPRPIDPDTRGTVDHVDDMGTLHCSFDNGRRLGVIPGVDTFRKLTSQELAEEQTNTTLDDQIHSAERRKSEPETTAGNPTKDFEH